MIKLGLMCIENYSDSPDALISLIELVKLGYQPPEEKPKRGKKPDFSLRSFLLLAVVAVVTKTFSDSELHRLPEGDITCELFWVFPELRIGRGLCVE